MRWFKYFKRFQIFIKVSKDCQWLPKIVKDYQRFLNKQERKDPLKMLLHYYVILVQKYFTITMQEHNGSTRSEKLWQITRKTKKTWGKLRNLKKNIRFNVSDLLKLIINIIIIMVNEILSHICNRTQASMVNGYFIAMTISHRHDFLSLDYSHNV